MDVISESVVVDFDRSQTISRMPCLKLVFSIAICGGDDVESKEIKAFERGTASGLKPREGFLSVICSNQTGLPRLFCTSGIYMMSTRCIQGPLLSH